MRVDSCKLGRFFTFMGAGTEAEFIKRPGCPASHELLAFQAGVEMPAAEKKIPRHLARCEFCRAEVEFYRHYPQPDDPVESCGIPRPLRELAEALLTKDRSGNAVFERLVGEISGSIGRA
jgi:hypothetical protein